MLRFAWNRRCLPSLIATLCVCGMQLKSAADDQQPPTSVTLPPASPTSAHVADQDTDCRRLASEIDRLIERDAIGPLATICTDAEFIRRIWLDLAGQTPPVAQVRAFLADSHPEKRRRIIDELLLSDHFVRHLTQVLDVMLLERRTDKSVPETDWEQYLVTSLVENRSLDTLFRELLSPPSVVDQPDQPTPESPTWVAARFLLSRDAEPNAVTRDVGRMTFGMDLQCAQCHDHPLIDDYYQADYYGLFAFVQRTGQYTDPKSKQVRLSEKPDGTTSFKSVFTGDGKEHFLPRLPKGAAVWQEPHIAKGEEFKVAPQKNVPGVPRYSRREVLATMLRDNRLFQRNLANRLWAMVMGRGLVHPLDHHHAGNPPTHPELLTLLANELVRTEFNPRSFLRAIVNSRAYQRSCQPPAPETINAADLEARIQRLQFQQQAFQSEVETAITAANASRHQLEEAVATAAALDQQLTELQKPVDAAHQQTVQAETALKQTKAVRELLQQQLTALENAARSTQLAAAESTATESAGTESAATESAATESAATESGGNGSVAIESAAIVSDATTTNPLQEAQAVLVRHVEEAVKSLAMADQKVTLAQQELAAAESAEQQARKVVEDLAGTRIAITDLQQLEAVRLQTADALADHRFRVKQLQASEALAQSLLEFTQSRDSDTAAAERAWPALVEKLTINAQIAPLKPLTPEQLAASMMEATGALEKDMSAVEAALNKKPPVIPENASEEEAAQIRRVALNAGMINRLRGTVRQFVTWYGGLPGEDFQATAGQALFFGNGKVIDGWISPSGNNLMARLKPMTEPDAISDELYFAVFCRPASAEEQREIRELLTEYSEQRDTILSEVVWAMLSSTEFRFNH